MTERELQTAVIRAAQLLGWSVFHVRPGRTRRGWRTCVEGDGVGWPDAVLVKDRILYREIKAGGGRLTPAQIAWLERLRAAGADAEVWTADQWRSGEILEELKA
jgi:hypothetical protein